MDLARSGSSLASPGAVAPDGAPDPVATMPPEPASARHDSAELGSLRVVARDGPAGLTLVIEASEPEARRLLLRHAGELGADLRAEGMGGVRVAIEDGAARPAAGAPVDAGSHGDRSGPGRDGGSSGPGARPSEGRVAMPVPDARPPDRWTLDQTLVGTQEAGPDGPSDVAPERAEGRSGWLGGTQGEAGGRERDPAPPRGAPPREPAPAREGPTDDAPASRHPATGTGPALADGARLDLRL